MSTAAEKPTTPSGPPPAAPADDGCPPAVVLHGVRYGQYVKLRKDPANGHLRMTYHDGVLELMSPEYVHEQPSRRISTFISVLCEELDIEFEGVQSTTFKRGEPKEEKGHGKEPDQAFYFANVAVTIGKKRLDLRAVPPPDLWVEVDNRSSSAGSLPLYAALGIPEVWRLRVASNRLRFYRLNAERTGYDPIERSDSLPMLTPALVLEGLALGEGKAEGSWTKALRAWVRATFGPAAGA